MPDGAHGAAITEPHPHLSDCQPDVFTPGPVTGAALILLSENRRRGLTLHDSSRLPSVLTVL